MAKKSEAEVTMVKPNTSESNFMVPLKDIVVDWKKNSRKFKSEANIKSTADSFKKQGQITPVRLSPRQDKKYDLVSGYTRYEAAKLLGWEALAATVTSEPLSDARRLVENVVENEVRKDLTPYEQAFAYAELAKTKDDKGKEFTQNAIADLAGKSQGYVSRLIAATEQLHPKLLDQWRKDCEASANGDDTHTPILNTQDLKWLIKQDKETQLKFLDEKIHGPEETDDESEADSDADPDKPETQPRTSAANLKRALAAAEAVLKASKNVQEHQYAEGVIKALKFALRDGRGIDGVCKYKAGKDGKGGKVITIDGENIAAPRSGGKAKIETAAAEA